MNCSHEHQNSYLTILSFLTGKRKFSFPGLWMETHQRKDVDEGKTGVEFGH